MSVCPAPTCSHQSFDGSSYYVDVKEKDKRTNNDLQDITHKTKDRVTRTPLITGDELMCSGRVISSCVTSVMILLKAP